MKNGLFKLVISLIAAISLCMASACLLSGCGTSEDSEESSSIAGKVIVKISDETATVAEFETVKLSATVENGEEAVKWSTSDGSVATVDENGLVSGIRSGKCKIIAISGSAMASCSLTVTESVYAPVIKVTDKITIENGKSYVGEVKVLFKGEDVTEKTKIEWSLVSGYDQICNVAKDEGTVTFVAKSFGEAEYYVSATYNGIFVNKLVSVKVVDSIATVVPDGDISMGDDGYELKLFTLPEAGETEMPISFTAYQGDSVVKNAVINWDLDSEWYDSNIAEITGENGNYVVKKVSAGTTDIVGTYRAPDGKNVNISIKVVVEKAVKTLDIRPEIEVEDLKPIVLPDSFGENVLSVTLDGVNVLSSVSDKNVNLNKAKLPQTADKLGTREMILTTADVNYKFTADMYTLKISNKAEFDKMRDLARSNGNVSNTGVLDGYFVLDNNIEYNAEFVSMTDSGEVWSVNNKLGGAGWDDSSKYGFKGVFDGRGYNVNGITVKSRTSERESGGIFGYLNNDAVIKNVSFTDAGLYENNGFICSYGGGLIENVSISFAKIGMGNENRDLFSEKGAPRTMGAFFSSGASESAKVINCFVDALGADIAYVTNKDRSDLANVVLGTTAKKVENLIVACDHAKSEKILSESGASYTATSYGDFSASSSLKGVIGEFDEDVWTTVNGIPFVKYVAETIDTEQKIAFEQIPEMIALGSSSNVKINTRYGRVTADGLYGGITFENGVIDVPKDAGIGKITLKAVSYINGSEATAEIEIADSRSVTLEQERQLIEATDTEIDLSFASDYIGDNATVTYGGEILGSGAIESGKLTVDLTGIDETGGLAFKVVSKKGDVYYTFDINAFLATKIIRTADDLLDALSVGKASGGVIKGYYILDADIDMEGKKVSQTLTSGYWTEVYGFCGTFDGQKHTISNFIAGACGLFGHIGKGAVIKDVNFSNVSCNNDYLSAVLARTIYSAELSNINVGVASFAGVDHDRGLLASRYVRNAVFKTVKIDASACTVYSLFGNEVGEAGHNTYSGVEIKVKSYTMFANKGTDVNTANKKTAPDGVTVTEVV